MPFHLWSTDTPENIEKVFSQLQTDRIYTNKDIVDIGSSVGVIDNERRISHLTQYWYILGLLNRQSNQIPYKYSVSEFGKKINSYLSFNKPLGFEILHFSLCNAWIQLENEQWGWSWVYKRICEYLWETMPKKVNPQQVLSEIIAISNVELPKYKPSINPLAVNTTLKWLSCLTPPFVIKPDGDDGGSLSKSEKWMTSKRISCNPELFILAISSEYKTRQITFGTHLLIDKEIIMNVSKTCLLSDEVFWDIAGLAEITFSSIFQKKESLYGSSLNLLRLPDFAPPTPQSLNEAFMEEDE